MFNQRGTVTHTEPTLHIIMLFCESTEPQQSFKNEFILTQVR